MPQYLLAYHGGSTPESEEAQAKVMTAWNEWLEEISDSLVDGGNPTGMARTVTADGGVMENAGSNPVTGYSIVDADDIEEAIEMARGCPVLQDGGSVEVAELLEFMPEDDEEDNDDDEDDEDEEDDED